MAATPLTMQWRTSCLHTCPVSQQHTTSAHLTRHVWHRRYQAPGKLAVCAVSRRHVPCKAAKAPAPRDENDFSGIHPNVIGFEDLKDLKVSADKFADDLAARVDSGEIGEDKLYKDYGLLSEEVEAVSSQVIEGLQGTSVYLVGMMGSGKSTVGKLLASILKYCYFDTDALIEQASGKTIATFFEEDGEQEFREAETRVLQELQPYKELVVATGGGIVLRRENWGAMQHGIVVRLSAPTDLLARRVVAQGKGSRPLLAGQDEQTDELTATASRLDGILEQREHLYSTADITVSVEGVEQDSCGAPTAVVVHRILKAIDARIKSATAEREAKQNFVIEGLDKAPETMQVVDAPIAGVSLEEKEQ